MNDGRLVVASQPAFQPLLLPFTKFFDVIWLFVARLSSVVQRQFEVRSLDIVVHSKLLLPFSAMFLDTKISETAFYLDLLNHDSCADEVS